MKALSKQPDTRWTHYEHGADIGVRGWGASRAQAFEHAALSSLERHSDYELEIPQTGAMRVPAVIYASEALLRDMDRKVYGQAVNVATPASRAATSG